jgi:glutathione S-transferase
MKLYGFPMSPNVRRVQIALEEAGRAYELIPVDLTQGEHKKPDYISLNPHGRVPTLVDGELVLWESHAICDYVASLCPESKLSGQNPEEVGRIAQWTYLNAAHFGPAFAGIFAHTIRLPEEQRIARIAENGRAEVQRIFAVLDRALEGKSFLVGERITLADISFAPSLAFAPMLGFDLGEWPNVARWVASLRERPSVKKVLG